MTVTRFDIFGPEFEAAEDAGGEWVQYVDHAAALTAANARADAAEAALAAQIEVDAGIAEDLNDYIWDYSTGNRGRIGSDPVAEAIRAQPHDRTALDRLIAKAEADALRRAADAADMVRQIPKEGA